MCGKIQCKHMLNNTHRKKLISHKMMVSCIHHHLAGKRLCLTTLLTAGIMTECHENVCSLLGSCHKKEGKARKKIIESKPESINMSLV